MPTDPSSALPTGMKVDQYVVKGVLGRGGFGITYLVEDAGLQKDFALKEFFPDGLAVRDGGKLVLRTNAILSGALEGFTTKLVFWRG